MKMQARSALALALAALVLCAQPVAAADSMYKCTANGSVSYQRDPCPSGAPRVRPTVEQLNAERKKKLLEAKAAAPPASGAVATAAPTLAQPAPVSRPQPGTPARPAFACDGRQHCSQMTSCAEARYFLAHCPNVKMDGDHDGIPCEDQWCR